MPTVRLPSANQVVEFLTVVRRDVLHVSGVLKPSFDLKTRDARVNERFQIAALIVVHQTQNVLTVGQLPSVAVKNGVGQAARLGAGSAVRTAARFRTGQVTAPGIGDAERTVHEKLNACASHCFAAAANFFERQFPCEHNLVKPEVIEKSRFFRCADVALCGSMDFEGRQRFGEQPHVLNDEGINTGIVSLPREPHRLIQLIVEKNGIKRHVDAGMIVLRPSRKLRKIIQGIPGGRPSPKPGAADINGSASEYTFALGFTHFSTAR